MPGSLKSKNQKNTSGIEKDVFFLTLVYVDIYIFTNRFFCDVL